MKNWKDVADALVRNGAPVLGKTLGTLAAGPGGGMVGEQLGKTIAARFGVDAQPAFVYDAVYDQPDAIANLENDPAILSEAIQYLQEETRQTQLSYRQELVSGSRVQKYWRPLNGYVLAAAAFALTLTAIIALFTNRTDDVQTIISALLPVLAILGGVVGVSAWGRSQEKTKVLDWHGRT